MIRRRSILTAAAAALALLGATGPSSAGAKVRVAITSYGFLFLPVFVAQELGFFTREGLDVEIINTGSAPKAYAALAGGNVEMLVASPVAGLRARAAGVPSLIIGAITTQYASNIVISTEWAKKHQITPESSYEQRLAALKGITIGTVDRGGGVDQLIHFLAKEAKLDADRDMEIPVVGAGEAMLAAFSRNRIQGFGHSSPVSDQAVKTMNGFMLFNTSRGEVKPLDGFLYITAMAREDWAKANEQTAARFLRAIQAALIAIGDPAQTNKARDAVRKAFHSNTDEAFYATLWESNAPAFPKSIALDAKMIARVVDFVNEFDPQPLDKGAIDGGWSNHYAERALKPSSD